MIEPIQPTTPTDKKPCCQPKPFLLMILSILVIAGSLYLGVNIGKKQAQPNVIAEPTIAPQATEVTPILDETANWKTYTESKYGLSFKYEPSEIVSRTENNSINGGKEVVLGAVYQGNAFSLFIDENSKKISLLKYSEQFTSGSGVSTQLDKTIGSLVGTYAEFPGYQGYMEVDYAHLEFYMQGASGQLYRFRLYTNGMTVSDSDRIVFNQILSTFKFTDTSAASETGQTIPADLVALIKSDAINNSPAYKLTPDQIKLGTPRIIGNFAQIPVNVCTEKDSCPGHIIWAAKVNGVWKIVTGGQEAPSCTILSEYNFPKDFECNP